ncbi:hypothetical protein L0F63_005628 [Massospora cicadina]|nr:hypothetical protein L0F63_005628 [Massospora cicadina]
MKLVGLVVIGHVFGRGLDIHRRKLYATGPDTVGVRGMELDADQSSVFKSYQSPIDLTVLPIDLPKQGTVCRVNLLEHGFGNSYGAPYVGNYTPPKRCLKGSPISRAVISYHAHVKGRQFDRFGALFIDGVEILRTTTAEPTPLGIGWRFEVDVSNYAPLFYAPRTVTHILGNLVNEIYTGVIIVGITLDLYPGFASNHQIIPLSRKGTNEPWFTITDGRPLRVDIGKLPTDIYQAELEIFLSGHGCDEFYYLNPPDAYAAARGQCRNGPYRELQVSLGDTLVGGVWPFPTIYTGGITLSLWRPLSGLGSFVVPTAILDLAPVIPQLNQNDNPNIRFRIINATSQWLVSANLHLWTSPIYSDLSPDGVPIVDMVGERVLVAPDKDAAGDDGYFETRIAKSYTITSTSSHNQGPGPRKLLITSVRQTTQFFQSLNLTQNAQLTTFNVTRTATTTVTSTYRTHYPNRQVHFTRSPMPSYTRTSTYSLTGTLYSKDLGQLPGYNFSAAADSRAEAQVREVRADHGYITYDQPTTECNEPPASL